MISENKDYIIKLFKECLDIILDDSDFKAHKGNLAVYFYFRGRSMYIWHNEDKKDLNLCT